MGIRMKDKIKLIEALNDIIDIAKTQNNELSMDEVNSYIKNLSLNENDREHVLDYLSANQVRIKGYIKKHNPYIDLPDDAMEDQVELDKKENKQNTKEAQEDETYLAMYLKELNYIKPVSFDEESTLIDRMLNHDLSAKNRLIELSLKEVVSIANSYKGEGILVADLIQEGNIGLIYGIDSYRKQEPKVEFKTHLFRSIAQAMEAAIDELSSAKNFDKKVIEKVSYIRERLVEYMTDLGRKPTIEESASYLDIPVDEMQDIIRLLKEDDVPIQ